MNLRDLMGAGSSLLLVAAFAAGEAKAEELDGELLARAAEFLKAQELQDRLTRDEFAAEEGGLDERANLLFEEGCRLEDVQAGRADEIAALPARTTDGLRAKAEIVRAFYGDDPPGGSIVDCVIWSLVLDLVRRPA